MYGKERLAMLAKIAENNSNSKKHTASVAEIAENNLTAEKKAKLPSTEYKYFCKSCSKVCDSLLELKVYIIMHHPDTTLSKLYTDGFKCPLCNSAFFEDIESCTMHMEECDRIRHHR